MILAAIDIGSNTLRLLVGEVKKGNVKPIFYDRVVTRLASGIEKTGNFTESSVSSTISAIESFKKSANNYGARRICAVGTSALREAENSKYLIDLINNLFGISVVVIEGHKEAELCARGVLSSMSSIENSLIVDIGGGSSEFILCLNKKVVDSISIPIGVVKLSDRFIKTDPVSEEELKSIGNEAEKISKIVKKWLATKFDHAVQIISTAGTSTTLAAIDLALEEYNGNLVHGHAIKLERLRKIADLMTALTHYERSCVRGLEPSRADLIIPGIILTIKLMESLKLNNLTVSDKGLLEGILIQLDMGAF